MYKQRLKSQKSSYAQKPKDALEKLRNIQFVCDRKKWSSLSKAVCEINGRVKK